MVSLALRGMRAARRLLWGQQLQQQRLQLQKMESLGRLSAGIAHDFNNILAGINGFSQLAQRRFGHLDPAGELAEYLSEVIQGARACSGAVQAYGSNQGGNVQLLSLQQEIETALPLLRASLPSSIELHYRSPDERLWLKMDPLQLQQLIVNLVINARDSLGHMAGDICIELARESYDGCRSACSAVLQGEFVALSVIDNGSGMPPEVVRRVFEPFFTTREVAEGAGMGLAVVHGIMHSLQGHILLSSTPQAGTRMTLLFPPLQELAPADYSLSPPSLPSISLTM